MAQTIGEKISSQINQIRSASPMPAPKPSAVIAQVNKAKKRKINKYSYENKEEPHPMLAGLCMWTTTVKRGRKCSHCRRMIEAGERSLRYRDTNLTSCNGRKFHAEKTLCTNCCLKDLTAILEQLSQPTDEVRRQRLAGRKNPQTEW